MAAVTDRPEADWLAYLAQPRKPRYVPSAGTVDAHCHVFGPMRLYWKD
jgi:2-pyrone-4,6-dicarboxylate lactonase